MIISDSEQKEYKNSNICHICEKKIDMSFKDILNKNDFLIGTSDTNLEKVYKIYNLKVRDHSFHWKISWCSS